MALAATGASTRAIAPIIGKAKSVVHDDLQVSGNRTPEPDPVDEMSQLDVDRANGVGPDDDPDYEIDPAPAPQPEWTSASAPVVGVSQSCRRG